MPRFLARVFPLIVLLTAAVTHAQPVHTPEWRNETNYTIHVTLDTELDQLTGTQDAVFVNRSPDTLDEIVLLLYPNAYHDTTTAYARQQRKLGRKRFLGAPEQQRGWIELADTRINGTPVRVTLYDEHPDLARIALPEPLGPGDTLRMSTAFTVQIPAPFSRMNHKGDHYEISQWHPKFAMYDDRGWADYPYLDMGEFYYEFGDYDVTITLPGDYLVASTGVLATPSEIAWRDSLIGETAALYALLDKPEAEPQFDNWRRKASRRPRAGTTKTIRITADDVVDFAWSADPRHLVLHDTVTVGEPPRTVDLYTFVLPRNAEAWKRSTDVLKQAVQENSRWVGTYPYPQMTAIDGALGIGGGMEYPMYSVNKTTPLDLANETVLFHEATHTWCYGILGFDERRWPMLDEGLTSFLEYRHILHQYGHDAHMLPEPLKSLVPNLTHEGYTHLAARSLDLIGQTMPLDLAATEYPSMMVYAVTLYQRPTVAWHHMMNYLGEERFDRALHILWDRWAFHHPRPGDLRNAFEEAAGEELDWFFEGVLEAKPVDLALERVRRVRSGDTWALEVRVVNRGAVAPPTPLEVEMEDGSTTTVWVRPRTGGSEDVRVACEAKPVRARLAPDDLILDVNPGDNSWNPVWTAHPFFDLPQPHVRQILYAPLPRFNVGDGVTPALYFYRPGLPLHGFSYNVAGGWTFLNERLVYDAGLQWDDYYANGTRRFAAGLASRDDYGHQQHSLTTTWKAFPRFEEGSNWSRLRAELHWLDFYDAGLYDADNWSAVRSAEARLIASRGRRNFTSGWHLAAEARSGFEVGEAVTDFLRAQMRGRVHYNPLGRQYLSLTLFGGWIPNRDALPLQQRFRANGGMDPYFEDPFMLDRSGRTILSPVRHYRSTSGPLVRGYPLLASDEAAFSANLDFWQGNVGMFVDGGWFRSAGQDGDVVMSAGLQWELGFVTFQLPIYVSDVAPGERSWTDRHNLGQRYSFRLDWPVGGLMVPKL